MQRRNGISCFYFQYKFFVDENINSVTAVQFDSLIHHRQGYLSFKAQIAKTQFVAQALLIRRFQQTRPQMPVHFDCTCNYRLGKFINFHFLLCVLCGSAAAM